VSDEVGVGIETVIAHFFAAKKAILERTKGEYGKSGVVECPACKGELSYSTSSWNGHIHAQCNQCVLRWRE